MHSTRRGLLTGAAAVVSLGAVSSLASARSSIAIGATDETVVGMPTSVTIEPELTVTWDGFDERVTSIRFFVQARTTGEYETVIDETVPLEPRTAGEKSVVLSQTELLDAIDVSSSMTVDLRYVIVLENGNEVAMSSRTVDTVADALSIESPSLTVATTSFDIAVETPEPTPTSTTVTR